MLRKYTHTQWLDQSVTVQFSDIWMKFDWAPNVILKSLWIRDNKYFELRDDYRADASLLRTNSFRDLLVLIQL